jgi:hypothetical protein
VKPTPGDLVRCRTSYGSASFHEDIWIFMGMVCPGQSQNPHNRAILYNTRTMTLTTRWCNEYKRLEDFSETR